MGASPWRLWSASQSGLAFCAQRGLLGRNLDRGQSKPRCLPDISRSMDDICGVSLASAISLGIYTFEPLRLIPLVPMV